MDLSIIILTWNSELYIRCCLDSIIASLAEGCLAYEILVVDNGSKDGTVKLLQQFAHQHPSLIHVLELPKNLGTTEPRNMVLKRALGRWICILDSDVEVSANIFTQLIKVLQNDSSIGLAAPKIFYPSGNWQKSYDRFPTLLHKIYRFFRLKSIEQHEASQHHEAVETQAVDYAISAFWLFHHSLLNKVGLLDEKIFYSPEDVDYCLRIWQAGYKVVYVPRVSAVHYTQEISRGWKLNRAKFSHLKGLLYLFVKHKYFFRIPNFAAVRQNPDL